MYVRRFNFTPYQALNYGQDLLRLESSITFSKLKSKVGILRVSSQIEPLPAALPNPSDIYPLRESSPHKKNQRAAQAIHPEFVVQMYCTASAKVQTPTGKKIPVTPKLVWLAETPRQI